LRRAALLQQGCVAAARALHVQLYHSPYIGQCGPKSCLRGDERWESTNAVRYGGPLGPDAAVGCASCDQVKKLRGSGSCVRGLERGASQTRAFWSRSCLQMSHSIGPNSPFPHKCTEMCKVCYHTQLCKVY